MRREALQHLGPRERAAQPNAAAPERDARRVQGLRQGFRRGSGRPRSRRALGLCSAAACRGRRGRKRSSAPLPAWPSLMFAARLGMVAKVAAFHACDACKGSSGQTGRGATAKAVQRTLFLRKATPENEANESEAREPEKWHPAHLPGFATKRRQGTAGAVGGRARAQSAPRTARDTGEAKTPRDEGGDRAWSRAVRSFWGKISNPTATQNTGSAHWPPKRTTDRLLSTPAARKL